jgi:hypothetical protein
MKHFFYELSKEEKSEVEKLESKLLYVNGVPKEDEVNKNPKDAFRLQELYKKRNELAFASQN